ncbi:MAG: ribosomal RNA small subunit methyltransferase A [Acidobacteria bacterium]|nr:ribosomal RNA small subunit methyltransferase A [Acidobacteriota bacterium]
MGAYRSLVKPNEATHKKRFGQHFLRDTGVIDRIVRWIQPSRQDLFIEIGAGDGALSSRLASGANSLLAIEIDADCIPRLKDSLAPVSSASVVAADVLRLDLAELVSPHLRPDLRLRIAGNLPYNIATAIIEKLLHSALPVFDMAFMLQLEVAERITASAGTRQYGYFSVECQHHCDVRFGFKVSPACFTPRPKVSSATVRFLPKCSNWHPSLETDFEMIAKAAFAYRRKTIHNSLSRHPIIGKISNALLLGAGIEGSRRAERLSVQEYEYLTHVYGELKMTNPE